MVTIFKNRKDTELPWEMFPEENITTISAKVRQIGSGKMSVGRGLDIESSLYSAQS